MSKLISNARLHTSQVSYSKCVIKVQEISSCDMTALYGVVCVCKPVIVSCGKLELLSGFSVNKRSVRVVSSVYYPSLKVTKLFACFL